MNSPCLPRESFEEIDEWWIFAEYSWRSPCLGAELRADQTSSDELTLRRIGSLGNGETECSLRFGVLANAIVWSHSAGWGKQRPPLVSLGDFEHLEGTLAARCREGPFVAYVEPDQGSSERSCRSEGVNLLSFQ